MARRWWCTPVILATWEAEIKEIRRIKVWSQPGQIVEETISKIPNTKELRFLQIHYFSQVLVAHVCNPSYLEHWNWKDPGSRPAWTNSSQDPISKITRTKRTGDAAQAVQGRFAMLSPEFKLQSNNNKKHCFYITHVQILPLRDLVRFPI
jgi:hypothetical protein